MVAAGEEANPRQRFLELADEAPNIGEPRRDDEEPLLGPRQCDLGDQPGDTHFASRIEADQPTLVRAKKMEQPEVNVAEGEQLVAIGIGERGERFARKADAETVTLEQLLQQRHQAGEALVDRLLQPGGIPDQGHGQWEDGRTAFGMIMDPDVAHRVQEIAQAFHRWNDIYVLAELAQLDDIVRRWRIPGRESQRLMRGGSLKPRVR
jgi:hypothetical protein